MRRTSQPPGCYAWSRLMTNDNIDKARDRQRTTLLAIDSDELARAIARGCIGAAPPPGIDAAPAWRSTSKRRSRSLRCRSRRPPVRRLGGDAYMAPYMPPPAERSRPGSRVCEATTTPRDVVEMASSLARRQGGTGLCPWGSIRQEADAHGWSGDYCSWHAHRNQCDAVG
jgi:hypothetical protein